MDERRPVRSSIKRDKRYHIVEGANHMDLYDGKAYVAEAISVLAPFFEETL